MLVNDRSVVDLKNVFIISGILVSSSLVIAGCGGTEASSPVTVTATATQTQTIEADPPVQDDFAPNAPDASEYLSFLYSNAPELSVASDADLVELGNAMCSAWDSGVSLEETLTVGISSGVTGDALAALVVGASLYLCPRHAASIRDQADTSY